VFYSTGSIDSFVLIDSLDSIDGKRGTQSSQLIDSIRALAWFDSVVYSIRLLD
jgi:hypothetical protein